MTPRTFDATVADWLREGPERGPRHALDRALAATRRFEQRPAWVFPRRYLPRPLAELDLGMPASVSAAFVLTLTFLLLLALAIVLVGTRPRLRLPFVPAGDRPIAFQEGPAIFVARIDGSERRNISGDVPYAISPMFSPDGTQVAFLAPSNAGETGGRLLVAAFDGSAPLVDVSHGLLVVPGQVPSVTWSPDNTHLAFAARDGGVSRIYVTDVTGSQVVAITGAAADADLPTWSPDGTRIAFRVTEPDGANRHIRLVQPDGTGLESLNDMVAPDSSFSKPNFSPINNQLSYAVNYGYGSQTRALIDAGFTHTTELWTAGTGGYPDAGVPFSPNGKFVAFISATDGVIVADDPIQQGAGNPQYVGQLRRLGNVADCWIEWVPDGKSLYGGSPDGCAGVVVIPLDDPRNARRLATATSGFASWQLLLPSSNDR
jgi:WD40 repeat protein